MNKPVKTKLCWNCEGNVSRSAENCPYCAVYLSPDSEDLKDLDSSLTKAPYRADRNKFNDEVPKAPYSPFDESQEAKEEVQEFPTSPSQTIFKTTFLPLTFLTTGLISFFFSLMLLLFSENGKLTLQWDGELWYVYGILSLPLLGPGWKFLDQTESNEK